MVSGNKYKLIENSFLLINDDIPHSGIFNMEFDSWLFKLVISRKIKNVVRIYEWEKPTITYGKFQKINSEINIAKCNKYDIPFVKRPTGGRAILHKKDEITLSIILNNNSITPYSFRNTFLFAAEFVGNAIELLNINYNINLTPSSYTQSTSCFATVSQYEIVDDNKKKLAGIAQYFLPEASLIQISIPLNTIPSIEQFLLKEEKKIDYKNELIKKKISKKILRNKLIENQLIKFTQFL